MSNATAYDPSRQTVSSVHVGQEAKAHSKYARIALICTLPLIHLGSGEYLSFSFFAFATLLSWTILAEKRRVVRGAIHIIAPLLVLSILLVIGNADVSLILVNMREAVVIVVVACLAERGGSKKNLHLLVTIAGAVLLLAALQLSDTYSSASRFQLPAAWFNLDYGTLASTQYERFGAIGRPSGTYAEPSTLGAVAIATAYIAMHHKNRSLLLISFLLVLISQSASAIAGLLLLVPILAGRAAIRYVLLVAPVATLAFGYYLANRFGQISDGVDESTLQRLYYPAMILARYWTWSGISLADLPGMALSVGGLPNVLDNFFLGKTITGGIYLPFLMFALLRTFALKFIAFLCIMFFINGSPFYYDRFVLYAMMALFIGASILRQKKL